MDHELREEAKLEFAHSEIAEKALRAEAKKLGCCCHTRWCWRS